MFSFVDKVNIPDFMRRNIHANTARIGYILANSQMSLFAPLTPDLQWICDLASPDTPHKPKVRIFWTRGLVDNLTKAHFQTARAAIQDTTISFIAFTNDGDSYRTILANSDKASSIGFIPRALVDGNGKRWTYKIRSLTDLQPFLTIYELRLLVSSLSDKIFAAYGHDRLKLFDTIMLLVATKIYDEIENPNNLYLPKLLDQRGVELQKQFQSFCQLALQSMRCQALEANFYLDTDTLRSSLELLIPYSFRLTVEIDTQAEILGTFYQEVVSSTFRGSLGAYFTPKPIADLAVAICAPIDQDDIFDISCGSGTFLLSALIQAQQNASSGGQRSPRLFGSDIQERMVLTATLNCFLHGVYHPHIIHGDGLQIDLQQWHSLDSAVPKEGFSLIVGNPPFAGYESEAFLPYKSNSSTQKGSGGRVNKIIPFIAKVVQMLRPGGRAALVIPTSVLNAESAAFTELRKWLASEVEIMAIIGLPREAFAHTDCGIEGALLFFRRKSPQKYSSKVFFRTLISVGYDRRGRVTFDSDVGETINLWKRRSDEDDCWIALEELYKLDRWDHTWLEGYKNGATEYNELTHVRLTGLCKVVRRVLQKRDIDPNSTYHYFEVGDTDIDIGAIIHRHTIKGKDLSKKSRLHVPIQEGDVLLPNHRDSLIAKTATRAGRSAVLVTTSENGYITSNRFTVLEPFINPKILIFILNSNFVREQLVLHARGSASFDVRDKVLEQIWVPKKILDPERQQNILEAIEKRDRAQQFLDQAEAQLTQLGESLD